MFSPEKRVREPYELPAKAQERIKEAVANNEDAFPFTEDVCPA